VTAPRPRQTAALRTERCHIADDLPGRRSAGTDRLAVPPVTLTTVANQAFPVVGPRTWNDLPDDVTSAESLSTFRQRLKTHLFPKSFGNLYKPTKW